MRSLLDRILATTSLGFALLVSSVAVAETVTVEPSPQTYNFVSHYRVEINATPEEVWPVILDFKSWMYEFELSTVSGSPGHEGHVMRLYTGQDFLIQVTQVSPARLISIVNLPITFRGESGTGIGVFTLHETGRGTEVALTMSRRYTWMEEGSNPLREVRESEEFHIQTRSMWQDRFLGRLKKLVEGNRYG